MKIKKNLVRFGNSSGVIIDSIVKKSLDLNQGDDVWITIKKAKKGVKQWKRSMQHKKYGVTKKLRKN